MIFDARDRVFLCFREDLGIWNLPGGGAEGTESPWDAKTQLGTSWWEFEEQDPA